MDQNIIQKYINNLRINLTRFLKPNIGLEVDIYNCGNEGAVLIVYFKPKGKSIDKEIGHFESIAEVLGSIEQNFFSGNLTNFHFKGTNMMMSNNRIIIIKDNSDSEWTAAQLNDDLNKIVQPPAKSNQS